MFKIAVVIFRECLEIAILLGVFLAVTNPVKNSRIMIITGALVGVTIASIFALFASTITETFDGLGDEVFNSCIILITSGIISWTVVWMQGYTKKIRRNLGELSEKITSGTASSILLVFVVATSILREGAEIMLFVYSISSAEHLVLHDYVWGLIFGALGGFLVGAILYKGLINFAGKYIFQVSTLLLTLIAAGLASEAAGIMTSAGLIESLSSQLWDTSWLIDDRSVTGKLLNIITGYDSRPNGMQIIFYLGSIGMTLSMMHLRTMLADKSANRKMRRSTNV